MARLFICLLVLGLWAPALGARRGGGESRLAEAQKLYDGLQYAEVVPKLEQALASGELGPAQQLRAYALLGTVHVVLGHEDQARAAFSELLARDRAHRLDDGLSPKILNFFEQVRQEIYPPLQLRIDGQLRDLTAGRDSVVVELRAVRQGEGTVRLVLHYRLDDGTVYQALPLELSSETGYTATLPEPRGAAPVTLRYYAVATGPDGAELAHLGRAESPVQLSLAALPSPESESAPLPTAWLWAGAGTALAVVAIGATVTLLLVTPPPEPAASTLGTYTLE